LRFKRPIDVLALSEECELRLEVAVTSFDPKKIMHIHHDLHEHLPSEPALRTKALESLLTEKRLVNAEAIDAWIEMYRDEIGPKRGAQVVARAWRDPAFKTRLLANATEAIDELGFAGHATGHLMAVENSADVHNLVVCTLCSCYPFSILGMSPAWYKSNEYRARAVRDPRGVLAEFGVALSEEIEVRVWDSTSERRYLVVPQRPVGSEDLDEASLARLVTRNSMIGTDRNLSLQERGS
jgi:nitrile hydratase subunit alpha